MRNTGPIGPTMRRLRGSTPLPLVACLSGLDFRELDDYEHGYGIPTVRVLRAYADACNLSLPARRELEIAHRTTVNMRRANPWVARRRPELRPVS